MCVTIGNKQYTNRHLVASLEDFIKGEVLVDSIGNFFRFHAGNLERLYRSSQKMEQWGWVKEDTVKVMPLFKTFESSIVQSRHHVTAARWGVDNPYKVLVVVSTTGKYVPLGTELKFADAVWYEKSQPVDGWIQSKGPLYGCKFLPKDEEGWGDE